MVPTPQGLVSEEVPAKMRPAPGEEVVISGMSGIFPMSESVEEFSKNLYDKVDMVSSEDPRWVFDHPEVPKHLGKVKGMTKFDAQFFRVHHKQADMMEPMSRKLLEHAYGAIYDSGINPLQLSGTKVGVFIGSDFSESEKIVIYESIQRNGLSITGCNKSMYANRISYWIDGKGPSYGIDLACASSMASMELAYRSIRSGQCDTAIVGGCNLCLHPKVSLNFKRAGFLSLDGKTKCFDKNGEGYARADAVGVLFLQKAKYAKRIYSEIYHTQFSYSPLSKQGLPVRDANDLTKLFDSFYKGIGVSPKDVEYIEANGAALVEADSNELAAIGRVFGKENPISIGCVKSNMGSSEPASGICAVTKVCLAYHYGKLPGNLHYNEPIDIPEVKLNQVKVLTDTTPFNRGYAALNSFSYGGGNLHILLKGRYKEKDVTRYVRSIPHLVLMSGRKEECIVPLMESLKKKPVDPEEIGLLHNIHQYDIPGHMCRGYTILSTNAEKQTVCLAESSEYSPGTTRPLWFVYSGMGSQWATMGADLMRIPIFAAAIQKCHKVLEPKGIDIVRILTEPDKSIYDNILNSFVGIAAVQIGLTDILTQLGIVPDNIIGHSVGELGCAYADGCFTAEEMILSAYSRGLVSVQTPFIRGSMAAVGMGYKDVLPLCPPGIEVACHNSADSATISGPADIMKEFVANLTAQGIFAKEVPCSNIAYHSKYIADAGPGLLKYLSEVIKTPKLRSKKWVSTSVPEEKWDDPIALYSSAEYHTNNLLNSVLFEETSKLIPSNALVIEVAPHGLLQAILKRSLSDCMHVPLTRRGAKDSVQFFLEAVGKLYQAGLNPKIDVMYPTIEYPVSTGTPLLSQYVKWEHSEDWAQAQFNDSFRKMTKIREVVISIHDDDYSYIKGHVKYGKNVFPEAAFLQLVWENLAMYQGVNYKDLSVMFRDVCFLMEAVMDPEIPSKFMIVINKGNNRFEVTHKNESLVTGYISELQLKDKMKRDNLEIGDTDKVTITAEDIYTIMRIRGYSYRDEFQSINSINSSRTQAKIQWTENWVTFLDSIFQCNDFARNCEGVYTPSRIKKLIIDVKHQNDTKKIISEGSTYIDAELYSLYEYSKCGGVEVEGLVFQDIPVLDIKQDIVLFQEFVPHFITGNLQLKTALQINLQVVADNIVEDVVKITNLLPQNSSYITCLLKETVAEIQDSKFVINSFLDESNISIYNAFEESHLLVFDNMLGNEEKMSNVYEAVTSNAFILTLEPETTKIQAKYELFNVITSMTAQKQNILLLKKANKSADFDKTYMTITQDMQFSWINKLKAELTKCRKVVLVSERQFFCGLLGMVKTLRKAYRDKIELIIVDDFHVPTFNPENTIFKEQLQKNMGINVLKKGQWGGYYYISGNNTNNSQNVILASKLKTIESLTWLDQPTLPSTNMNVQVCYAGLSFRDSQFHVSKTKQQYNLYGMDFSGLNNRGEKVMGLIPGGAIATTIEADPDLLWPVPEHWTLEDAATVPLPYILAYYCYMKYDHVVPLTNVFVQGGSGALGQAVVAVFMSLGYNVITLVSDSKKKEFLLRLYPDLDEKNVVVSTDDLYSDLVIASAGGYCGLVINCLSGSMRNAALKCSGIQLRALFLDLSESDMINNKDFEMNFLASAKSYVAVRISSIFNPEFAEEKKKLRYLLCEGIAKGDVRPLSRVVYSPANVTNAFRLLSTRRNRGKVLIKMDNPESLNQDINITLRTTYSPSGTYIVVCDDKPVLGMELADHLVKQGARKLIINMKPITLAGYTYLKLLSWNKFNVNVKITTENPQTEKGCVNLLKEGGKLGPILGIFIVQNFGGTESLVPEDVAAKFYKRAGVVANLDLTSRNICNELDHFVVLSHGSQVATDAYMVSAIDKICYSRKGISLPALSLHFGPLKEFDSDPEKSRSTLSKTFDALEASLKLKYCNALSVSINKNSTDEFIHKLSNIIGVENINEINNDLSVKDIHASDAVISEIKNLIKHTYDVSYSHNKIQEMTVGELRTLETTLSQEKPKMKDGLGAFFTKIETDEWMAGEPTVTMGTTFSSVKVINMKGMQAYKGQIKALKSLLVFWLTDLQSTARGSINIPEEEHELDPKATYLMLAPGFEGHHHILNEVCERLKVQAFAFQYVTEFIDANIPEMAANIYKFIKRRTQLKSKFYLLGYSFGVNVALELAALFEKDGFVGVVYCLDSSPDALRAQLDAYVGHLTDAQLQNNLIEHMYGLMNGEDSQGLMKKLEQTNTWEDKIETCVNKLRGKVNFSHEYQRCILQGSYRRMMLARKYNPDFKLQSELVLIKGTPHPKMEKMADDYGLSKYSTQPVKMFNIEADHASAPYDGRVTNIVNKMLEPELQETFKTTNRCWSYLIHSNINL